MKRYLTENEMKEIKKKHLVTALVENYCSLHSVKECIVMFKEAGFSKSALLELGFEENELKGVNGNEKLNLNEVLDYILDDYCELHGIEECLDLLVGYGVKKEDLIELKFDKDDIDNAIKRAE